MARKKTRNYNFTLQKFVDTYPVWVGNDTDYCIAHGTNRMTLNLRKQEAENRGLIIKKGVKNAFNEPIITESWANSVVMSNNKPAPPPPPPVITEPEPRPAPNENDDIKATSERDLTLNEQVNRVYNNDNMRALVAKVISQSTKKDSPTNLSVNEIKAIYLMDVQYQQTQVDIEKRKLLLEIESGKYIPFVDAERVNIALVNIFTNMVKNIEDLTLHLVDEKNHDAFHKLLAEMQIKMGRVAESEWNKLKKAHAH